VTCTSFQPTPISAITLTLERPLIWLCLLVVVLSVVYVVIIGRKYTDYVHATQPYIEEATERNAKLGEAIKAEKEIAKDVVNRVKDEELLIGDLKIGMAKLESEIIEERALEEKLELAQQVKQFNKKKS
jgi:hypothetical protein